MNLDVNDDICRICLKRQETLFSLYRNLHGSSPYQKLMSRTNLKIDLHDAGPASICAQCLLDLDTTVSFLERCERSNLALAALVSSRRDVIQTVKNANIDMLEDEVWLEPEPLVHVTPPTPAVKCNASSNNVIPAVQSDDLPAVSGKCPECSSKRRCAHWLPPSTYTCTHCDKKFNKKYNYQIHLKRHTGSLEWSCPTCGVLQVSASLARRHCLARPRRCCPVPACDKTFTNNTNLRTHLRSHTGEKPFECHDCGKGFTSKNTLRCHLRIHTGEKPYICPVCGVQFTWNRLSAHVRTHSISPARQHARTNSTTPARKHACTHCPRTHTSRAALRSHARTHDAQKPFACALCAATYKFKQSLNRHVKRRHGVLASQ